MIHLMEKPVALAVRAIRYLSVKDEKAHPHPKNCDGVEKVTTIPELEEFMIRRPCIYGLPSETLLRRWIAWRHIKITSSQRQHLSVEG
jgi:hypothetical protein